MKTFYPYGGVPAIQVPAKELRHLAKDQQTVSVRGYASVHVIQNADGSYAGWIKINDAERCKEGLCNPRIHADELNRVRLYADELNRIRLCSQCGRRFTVHTICVVCAQ